MRRKRGNGGGDQQKIIESKVKLEKRVTNNAER